MDAQDIINVLFAACGALLGWTLKRIWTAVDHLQEQDKALAEKVQAIEVLVAGTYVKRDDLEKVTNQLFHQLDRIESKLDGKVDK
jgi:hypothetical protein